MLEYALGAMLITAQSGNQAAGTAEGARASRTLGTASKEEEMLGREGEGRRMQQAYSHATARHRDAFLLLSRASASATASLSNPPLHTPLPDPRQHSCAGAVFAAEGG